MYKKWLSCALSVLCSFCLFWGLYSNTLEVKAASVTSFSRSISVYSTATSCGLNYYNDTFRTTESFTFTNNASGNIQAGSGNLTSVGSTTGGCFTRGTTAGSYHFKIPITINESLPSDLNERSIESYYLNRFGALSYSVNAPSGVEQFHAENFCLTTYDGNLLVSLASNNASNYFYNKGSRIFANSPPTNFGYSFYLEFDVSWQDSQSDATLYQSLSQIVGFTVNFSGWFSCDYAGDSNPEASTVEDSGTHQKLDDLNESTDAIQESVTSDTGGGLLATIKNFFGGFFTNIFNTILGLFVPDSTYFSTWFDNLNTLLSAKLGMLYAPFDLLISTLNAVYSADTTEPGITFPGITWNGETVIAPYTFYFSSLGEDFQNLRDAVYFGTDVVLLFAFLHLLQKKIALVITGSEVNG